MTPDQILPNLFVGSCPQDVEDIDRLKREAGPHPDTSAYVAVIQAGEHLWFRTPDISPDRFWADFPRKRCSGARYRPIGPGRLAPVHRPRFASGDTTRRSS